MDKQQQQPSQNSSDEQDKSAAKIQAGVRGYLVRKHQRQAKEAATKIQAGYRGFRTRKEMKQQQEQRA